MVYNTVRNISLHIWNDHQKLNTCVQYYNLKLSLRLNSTKSTFSLQKHGLKMIAGTAETCSPLPTNLSEEIND